MNTLEITNGPGKSDLMFSLFDGKVVTFHICEDLGPHHTTDGITITEVTKPREFIIQALMAEDGSRSSWVVEMMEVGTCKTLHCYYHSGKRNGVVNPNQTLQVVTRKKEREIVITNVRKRG